MSAYSGPGRVEMSRDELLALPAAVDIETAGKALGFGRTKSHQLARLGQFPARTLKIGKAYRVITADLLAVLGIDPDGRLHVRRDEREPLRMA